MATLFDRLGDQFLTYYGSTQGVVRGLVVQENLGNSLPSRSLNVLDVGCGEGRDARWLASIGHTVTAIDPSDKMLTAARNNAKKSLSPEERVRLRFVQSDIAEAVRKFDRRSFDLITCHGVIMYQEDDERFVSQLAELMVPDGLISVLAKNSEALAYRSAAEGRYDEARKLLHQRSASVGRLKVNTRAHNVEELMSLLAGVGISTVDWFGVKVFGDGMTDAISSSELRLLLALERDASHLDPYRRSARLIHLVGRYTGGS